MENQKALLGFILGATAGALAGLLLAPSSGEDTRKKINYKAKGYKEDLGGQINTAINKLSGYVKEAQGKGEQYLADAESKAKSALN